MFAVGIADCGGWVTVGTAGYGARGYGGHSCYGVWAAVGIAVPVHELRWT